MNFSQASGNKNCSLSYQLPFFLHSCTWQGPQRLRLGEGRSEKHSPTVPHPLACRQTDCSLGSRQRRMEWGWGGRGRHDLRTPSSSLITEWNKFHPLPTTQSQHYYKVLQNLLVCSLHGVGYYCQTYVCVLNCCSGVQLCNPMDCSLPGSFSLWDSPSKNTGVGCHTLLQGIFPI